MDNQRKPALDQLTPQEKMARGSAWMRPPVISFQDC